MSKHTPGPWKLVIANTELVSIYPQGGKERIAQVYCPLDGSGGTINGNARLIAAAPEMVGLLKWYADSDMAPNMDKDARALLARIEGEK